MLLGMHIGGHAHSRSWCTHAAAPRTCQLSWRLALHPLAHGTHSINQPQVTPVDSVGAVSETTVGLALVLPGGFSGLGQVARPAARTAALAALAGALRAVLREYPLLGGRCAVVHVSAAPCAAALTQWGCGMSRRGRRQHRVVCGMHLPVVIQGPCHLRLHPGNHCAGSRH